MKTQTLDIPNATQNVRRSTVDVTFRTPNLSMSPRSDTLLCSRIAASASMKKSFKRARVVRADAAAEDIQKAYVPIADIKDTLGRGFVVVDIDRPMSGRRSKST